MSQLPGWTNALTQAIRNRVDMLSNEDIIEAHAEGTIQRVRPKLMTVATMLFGLVPLLSCS